MKLFISFFFLTLPVSVFSQELFSYSEPASNMAAKSIGFRFNNFLMEDGETKSYNYHLLPEFMIGVSKKIMIHAEGFISNRNKSVKVEGGSLYMKYRLFSVDEVHSHFRLAALGRIAFNNSDVHQAAIDFNGHNSGYELGLVATKLVHKIAVSAGTSFVYAFDNGKAYKFSPINQQRNALAYNLAVGKLLLPKEYTSYNQLNMNGMIEVLGQSNLYSGKSFIDLAPSIQFIVLSRMRIDFGYRFPLVNELERTAGKGFLLRIEYTLFNVFR